MTYRKTLFIMACALILVISVLVTIVHGHSININNSKALAQFKDKSAQACDPATRPIAVMISSDPEARPLSGIGQADMVFEMPVTPNGITRMMAVFKCSQPAEIGSVRSSRLDYIPIAQGLGVIYAHWGGEHNALNELNSGIIDNVDGLKYEGTTFFRKHTIAAPHNGFTSYALISQFIQDKHYATTLDTGKDYQFSDTDKSQGNQDPPSVYDGHMHVDWHYNVASNSYDRIRDGQPEMDHTTHQQVAVKNVIIMKTTQSPMSKDYIRVTTIGSGKATIYQNGQAIVGTWKKATAEGKLFFLDNNGHEIKFTPSSIWVEIITP